MTQKHKVASQASESNTYSLSVDYERNVEDAIKACQYGWVDSEITSQNFSSKREGKTNITFKLIHPTLEHFAYRHCVSTDEILDQLREKDLRPAELQELLCFGEMYPNVQCKGPVVALGSVFEQRINGKYIGYQYVPVLYRFVNSNQLMLKLTPIVRDSLVVHWGTIDWFAAVHK